MIRKNSFVFSGAVQTAPIYYYLAGIGAAASLQGTLMAININKVCSFYYSKKEVTAAKKAWLAMPTKDVLAYSV